MTSNTTMKGEKEEEREKERRRKGQIRDLTAFNGKKYNSVTVVISI